MKAVIKKNDKLANILIGAVSATVLIVVVLLGRLKAMPFPFDFDVHVFAFINAIINSLVAVLLVVGLFFAKNKKLELHKKTMMTAIIFSVIFLVFYIGHHLFAGDTFYGDLDNDGVVSEAEKALTNSGLRIFYYIILITHIVLAAVMLPFILFTAYRGLTAEFAKHKKIAKITWPIWFYIAITGVLIYILISPYY